MPFSLPGHLLYLPLPELLPLLSLLLSLITLHSLSASDLPPFEFDSLPSMTLSSGSAGVQPLSPPLADPEPILKRLAEEHAVPSDLALGVMDLFGKIIEVDTQEEDGKRVWIVDVPRIVKEMGKGMLLAENVSHSAALTSWPYSNCVDRVSSILLVLDIEG